MPSICQPIPCGRKKLPHQIQDNRRNLTDRDFASATNYGLAIELYLKTLLIMEGENKIRGHLLDELYENLTEDTKTNIATQYKTLDGNNRQETLYIRGCIDSKKAAPPKNQPNRGTKIDQLLKNNRNIFIIYRYMFEKARGREWEEFCFEFGNLDLLISALSITASGFLSQNEIKKTLVI